MTRLVPVPVRPRPSELGGSRHGQLAIFLCPCGGQIRWEELVNGQCTACENPVYVNVEERR